ncbi:ROK family transcriptional regulator [Defluviimonas aestuarii]|uniref:ROK family transcriptional regulator n=1 Tax=Albidovulum aestuarii TaxID=1130726 RepID=UPI002499D141|nr:ROK family transcriptional regulator [Defluviimonas aestuarii]MDI3336862.1 ROK family transcriptional regulator [Defluviimonas aestuarii]
MPEAVDNLGAEKEIQPTARGSNQAGLRVHNERLILSLLRSLGPTAKAEIARLTGLSAQTASVIMRKLEKEGLIKRCAPVRGKVGQPSIPMQLAPDGALFFGLKIGRRSADLVLVDFLGHSISRKHQIHDYPEPDSTIQFVRTAVAQLTDQLTARQRRNIAGLGIAIPGHLWEWGKLVGDPDERMSAWRDRDIRSEIDDLFDFPVYLQNDASCACGAELVFGPQDYPNYFLYFYVGYFIGGGVVVDGSLLTGPTGNAGALAPLPIPSKSMSNRQLIDVASLSVLEKMIAVNGGDANVLWENSNAWNVDHGILDAWLVQAADGLAYAIVASCAVIDFELIVFDGWLPEQVRHDLVELIKRKLPEFDMTGLTLPELREGSIGPDARSLGAASLPLSQRFLISPRSI